MSSMKIKVAKLGNKGFAEYGKSYTDDVTRISRTNAQYERRRLMDNFTPDAQLRELLEVLPTGAIVAGGHLLSLVTGTKSNDIDIFFTKVGTPGSTVHKMVTELRGMGYSEVEAPQGCRNFSRSGNKNVQLIIDYIFDNPEHIIDSFDFRAVQFACDATNLWTGESTMDDARHGELNFHQPQDLRRTFNRLIKYTEKGFNATPDALRMLQGLVEEALDKTDIPF